MSENPINYLIIGNSAGGIGAAEAIREVDAAGSITLVSDEPYLTYSRPLIAEYLAQRCPLERMNYRPADFYKSHNIQTILGKKAVKLLPVEHIVELDSGERIRWEKLLLATGGLPIVPPMKGRDKKGVFSFIKLDDAKAIDEYLPGKTRAVVIGGGLIGVSVAEALVKRGVEVTIIEMKERVLNVMLDETASALEEAALRQAGVTIVTGRTVAEINGETAVTGVTLDNGQTIPGDVVVIAIGVRPRTDLVAGTDIKVNRGIVVDRRMATSVPGIYACGDAAEAHDFVWNDSRPTPILPNAYLGGRVAGFNMAGKATEYPGGTAMNSLKYFGLDVISAGLVNPPDKSFEILSSNENGAYRKLVLKEGRIVGMVLTGDIERAGIVFSLIKNKVDVSRFKQSLVAGNFGLAHLPRELWEPHFKAPETATTITQEPEEALVGE